MKFKSWMLIGVLPSMAAMAADKPIKAPAKVEQTQAQPIPATALKDLYTQMLELQIARAQAQNLATQVKTMEQDYDKHVANLASEYKIKLEDWSFDLKAGTMKKVEKPEVKPTETPAPSK